MSSVDLLFIVFEGNCPENIYMRLIVGNSVDFVVTN